MDQIIEMKVSNEFLSLTIYQVSDMSKSNVNMY